MTSSGPEGPVDRPIRVMHVVDLLALAGMEYGVMKVANRLDPARVAVSICCLRFQADAAKAVLDPRIPVFALEERVERNLGLVLKLAGLFRRERIDIVHSHNWATYFYSTLAARLAGVPVHIHGEHGHDSQAPARRRLLIKRALAPAVTRFVAVSGDLGRELVQDWHLRPERVRLIANGVDLDRFHAEKASDALRDSLGIPPGEKVVVSVGGLRRIKDYPTLLGAFSLLRARLGEGRLVIVGHSYYREIREELDQLAETLGIRDQVIFTGVRQDVPALLRLCDVYVNSSLFEGMSNTILEAMAMGIPVVATRVGGNPELVTDGVTGYLVPPGDPGALARRVEALLRDPALRAAMGEAARGQVERRHRMESMVRANEELYRETVWRRRIRRHAPPRQWVKRAVARALAGSGTLAALGRIHPPGLAVLTYHRVLPLPVARDYPFRAMVIARDEFEGQIAHLARRYRVLPLGEAIERLSAGTLPPRAVSITFDDGYQDNYEHALPVLRRYGLPATFFVVTDALDGRIRLWWDAVAESVAAARGRLDARALETLPRWARFAFDASGRSAPRAIQDLVTRLNEARPSERAATLAAIEVACRGYREAPPRLMLSWDEAREMAAHGLQFESHTRTHAFLDEIGKEEAYEELSGSLARIAEVLGQRARFLAYPRGRASLDQYPVIRRAGIEAALTTQLGTNRPGCDLLALSRVDIGYSRLDLGFDASVFDAEMAGTFRVAGRD